MHWHKMSLLKTISYGKIYRLLVKDQHTQSQNLESDIYRRFIKKYFFFYLIYHVLHLLRRERLYSLIFLQCLSMCTAAAAKSLQLCLTLCDSIDRNPPGSPVPEILQARTLEWVAISFSSEWKWKVKGKSLGHVWLLATPWTAAYQALPAMGFSRQEYWNGVPLPSP